ncbi:dihydrofolate reductase family protein [Methanosphaerula palustris]|uniref:Bifunctional deaminase-reductase domain protein n=1 Tax=Methanosphaerula palustris (strain ATCC BAA-1556 / DSM 19958 / E1-9c) TaxID=521011 RepID=B8GGI1_METPE|nr:dihydrofolate reductase family protein [Methanosphaerula palustris]ACL16236.1 bifunctional deaminase-reductase domain protein [Methanosphaerula palustris E1-9c]
MGKVIVYIATSLDGFIARKDDDVSWLDPFSVSGEDYGYQDFIKKSGTAVMGARTYEQSLAHPERLITGLKNYILTSRTLPLVGDRTELWHGPLSELIQKIRRESKRDIYIIGGGQIISRFLNEGLIDEIQLFIVPVILGEGIPLFTGLQSEVSLHLITASPYSTGIVKLLYVPNSKDQKT